MRKFLGTVLASALALGCIAPAFAQSDEQIETQIGQQEYQQLQQKGEIVTASPYYAILDPIAEKIERIADPQYYTPFHFILVNEGNTPNAFAVPGGNVYVTTAMMKFVRNKEELAGVLCHETSHDIHHDVLALYKKNQQLSLYGTLLSVLVGRAAGGLANTAINLAANLESLHFSRNVEENADQKGAQTCAQAGITPWGMVWLMQAFQSNNMPNPPEFISDHPSDAHRIAALESEFAAGPALFSRYNTDVACGTPTSYSAGFYYQYRGGCGIQRRQPSVGGTQHRSTAVGRHIAPVSAKTKPKCPVGWKYCK